jgi:thiosulfate dehydrogenase [quinone] large subunit
MPPRGWLLAGWALLPLRAFLGVTFVYASLQKLANPDFFSQTAPGSLHQQMIGYIRSSPIHLLIGHLLQFSTPLGILMSLGELAVGIGILAGLWTRIAAIGGMIISFSLFLAVSFHSSPWFTGADIVYFFAFMPIVVAGAGGVLSVDALIARRASREAGVEDPLVVAIPFSEAQASCGFHSKGRCSAIPNRRCSPSGCPYLEGVRMTLAAGRIPDGVDRRTVVLGGVTAAAAAGAALLGAGVVASAGRLAGGVKSQSTTPVTLAPPTTAPGSSTGGATTTTSPLGTHIGAASQLPVGQSGYVTLPGSGDPGLVIQPASGQFVAYDAVCPHAGCTVGYSAANSVIVCPCHGSEFQVSNGGVINGPAPTGLHPYTVTESNGQLYLK